jgi:hypothetical protein
VPGPARQRTHAPRTARAVDLVVGERFEGTILYGNQTASLDRHGAARIVRRIAKAAGITKHVGPTPCATGSSQHALPAGHHRGYSHWTNPFSLGILCGLAGLGHA